MMLGIFSHTYLPSVYPLPWILSFRFNPFSNWIVFLMLSFERFLFCFVCFLFCFGFCFVFCHHAACGILVPWPGIEPLPWQWKTQSPNHWTTREFPSFESFYCVLDSSTLLAVLFANIFSQSVDSYWSLSWSKSFNFDEVRLISFSFYGSCFHTMSENSLPGPWS